MLVTQVGHWCDNAIFAFSRHGVRPDMQPIIHMPIARHVIVEECFTQQNNFISFFVFSIYPLFVYTLLLPPDIKETEVIKETAALACNADTAHRPYKPEPACNFSRQR